MEAEYTETAESKCEVCEDLMKQYETAGIELSAVDFISDIVKPEGKTKNKRKRLKEQKSEMFLKIMNALLNEGHGIMLVHSDNPHFLGRFDEAMNTAMLHLIPDDSFFEENFERRFKDMKHLLFRVLPKSQKKRRLSTYSFNSKLSTDAGLVDPTHGQVRQFLMRELAEETLAESRADENFTFTQNDEVEITSKEHVKIPFQESFRIQAKSIPESNKTKEMDKLTEYCFQEKEKEKKGLCLQNYISAFLKLPTGGSIFLGVSEELTEDHRWEHLGTLTTEQKQQLDLSEDSEWELYKETDDDSVYHIATPDVQVPVRTSMKSGRFLSQGITIENFDESMLSRNFVDAVESKMLLIPSDAFEDLKCWRDQVRASDYIKVTSYAVMGAPASETTEASQNAEKKWIIQLQVKKFRGIAFINRSGPMAYEFERTEKGLVFPKQVELGFWLKKNIEV